MATSFAVSTVVSMTATLAWQYQEHSKSDELYLIVVMPNGVENRVFSGISSFTYFINENPKRPAFIVSPKGANRGSISSRVFLSLKARDEYALSLLAAEGWVVSGSDQT